MYKCVTAVKVEMPPQQAPLCVGTIRQVQLVQLYIPISS